MGSHGGPFPIDAGDVRNAHIEEGAGSIRIRWRRERDRRLVVGRTTARVENQPAVRNPHDHGVALDQHFPVEQSLVELAGLVLVGHDEEVGDDEAFLWGGKVIGIDRHGISSLMGPVFSTFSSCYTSRGSARGSRRLAHLCAWAKSEPRFRPGLERDRKLESDGAGYP